MSWLGIERQTGIITGMWAEKSRCVESCKFLAQRWRGSSWSVAEIDLSMDEHREFQKNQYGDYTRWLNHHQDNNEKLESHFKKSNNAKFTTSSLGDLIAKEEFNSNNTAFDVLTDYAFGGDKQAALDYLKLL